MDGGAATGHDASRGLAAPFARLPWWLLALGVAVAYFAAARASLLLAVDGTPASPLWPPAGIAFAALLLWGRRMLPAVLVGAFTANLTSFFSTGTGALGPQIAVSAAIALGNTFEAFAGLWLVERFTRGRDPFASSRDLFRYFAVAPLMCVPAAVVGPAATVAGGLAPAAIFGKMVLTWWLGDMAAIFLVTPLIVLWLRWDPATFRARRLVEAAAIAALLAGAMLAAVQLVGPDAPDNPPLGWLALPFLVWAGLRAGPRGAIAAASTVSVISILETVRGRGPFALASIDESLLLLQASTITATITTLAIAITVEERRRATAEVQRAREGLEERVREKTAELARQASDLSQALSLTTATLDATADGLLVVDVGGRINTYNRRFQEMWRLSDAVLERGDDDAAIAAVLDQLVDPQAFLAKVRELYGAPDAESLDELAFKDGRVFERYSRPQVLDGRVVGRVWSFRDVTAHRQALDELKRRADALAESNAELERFAYVASHDLQEPLRTVNSFMQLLRKRYGAKLDDEAQEYITFATQGAQRMHALVNDLLAYSHIERQRVRYEEVDLAEVLREVLAALRPTIEEHAATVTADGLPTIEGDRTQMGQLLQNLVSNAVKFHAPGAAPRVAVGSCARDGTVELWVRDDGIGIAASDADRIFTIFTRLNRRDEYPGTGVGLSICKKIVEGHGGRIWFESEPGRGTTFHVELPVARPARDAPA